MKRKFAPAQMNYMEALAMYKTICEIEKECKTKVLADNEFFTDPEWGVVKRITGTKSDYLMSDADADKYFRLTFAEYQKRGIAPKDYQTVASWESHEALRQAEKKLIEWGYSVMRTLPEWAKYADTLEGFKDDLEYHLEIRKQVIELTMKVQAQGVA